MESPASVRRTKPRGRHPAMALSAAFCRTVARPGRYCDGNGLYLHVEPSGARRWVQRLVIHGKSRALGLGSFALVPLADAREQALANRRIARSGGDPRAGERRVPGIPTFDEAVDKVLAIHGAAWKAGSDNAKRWQATLREYAYPRLGGKGIDQVATADVMAVLQPIWTCVDAKMQAFFADQAPAVLRDSGAAPQRRDCSRGTRAMACKDFPHAVTRRAATEWRSRAAVTAAGDRARGRRFRAKRGPLGTSGSVHRRFRAPFRRMVRCMRSGAVVCPASIAHITRRGPVWSAGRVQNRANVLEGTGAVTGFLDPVSLTVCPYHATCSHSRRRRPGSCLLRRSAAARGSTRSSSSAPRRCAPSGWPAHGDQHARLARQHSSQPRVRAAPRRPADCRHRAADQQPPEVALRYPAQLRLPAGRILPGQARREVSAAPEALQRRREGLDRHRERSIPGTLISRTVCSSSRAGSRRSLSTPRVEVAAERTTARPAPEPSPAAANGIFNRLCQPLPAGPCGATTPNSAKWHRVDRLRALANQHRACGQHALGLLCLHRHEPHRRREAASQIASASAAAPSRTA